MQPVCIIINHLFVLYIPYTQCTQMESLSPFLQGEVYKKPQGRVRLHIPKSHFPLISSKMQTRNADILIWDNHNFIETIRLRGEY